MADEKKPASPDEIVITGVTGAKSKFGIWITAAVILAIVILLYFAEKA